MPEKELIIAQADITRRVKELGADITRDYKDSQLVMLGVLNGAFIFMADLVREVRLDMEIDFIRAASYGMDTSPGTLRFTKDIELDTRGKDILVVEDIIDTGRTLKHLQQHLADTGAHTVRICTLIDKKERREIDIDIDYAGFEVESGFLVGYGLDCREQYRHLSGIFHLKNV
jgi:hypoxanthine phosphoribosyltransferase